MEGQVLRCPSCGQANRVPSSAGGKTVVCGRCRTPLGAGGGDGHPLVLTDANFQSEISSGRVIVDFWAGWCGPCHMLAPVIDELARERKDVRFAKLNVDENARTAEAFGVQGIPLLIFFKDGAERGRVVGAVPRGRIEAAIQQYLS